MASKSCGPHKATSFTESNSVVHKKMKEDKERTLFGALCCKMRCNWAWLNFWERYKTTTNQAVIPGPISGQNEVVWVSSSVSPSFGGIRL
jgi:hypothetical protein